jgi:DNA-directed RNA polymerase alpha subunit
MTASKKSTDANLSAAERKQLRDREAKEAVAYHDEKQRAFHRNHDRLRAERLAREAAMEPMFYPSPALSDETPVERVRFPTRIANALHAAGLRTVGEVRETSDNDLLRLQDIGPGSVVSLRESLGKKTT